MGFGVFLLSRIFSRSLSGLGSSCRLCGRNPGCFGRGNGFCRCVLGRFHRFGCSALRSFICTSGLCCWIQAFHLCRLPNCSVQVDRVYTNGMKTTKFTLCPGIARLLLAHRELESKKAGSRENGVQRKIFRNERSYCTENTFENNLFTWYYTGKTPQTTIPTRFILAI